MAAPFIGELRTFGFNFNPVGWLRCEGQLLPIAQYDVLFALIGTTYGGDGQTTFGLPDLRGRATLHQGQGPGQPNYALGQSGGVPSQTLAVANMAAHSHALGNVAQPVFTGAGTTANPAGAVPAGSSAVENYAPAAAADGSLAPMQITGTAQPAGGGQPFDNMPPYLTVNLCIATEGIFPSRN